MTSVQFDTFHKQEINQAFRSFLRQARLILLFPASLAAIFVLGSVLRYLLRHLYRGFVVLNKEFERVLSSTTDQETYTAILERRLAFARKLEEVANTIDRIRPLELRDQLCSPFRLSEFRSFVSQVTKEARSDAQAQLAISRYASLSDAVHIPAAQAQWDPEKGKQQLHDLTAILPFIACSIVSESKSSD